MAIEDVLQGLHDTVQQLDTNVGNLLAQTTGKVDVINQKSAAVTQAHAEVMPAAQAVTAARDQVVPLAAQVNTQAAAVAVTYPLVVNNASMAQAARDVAVAAVNIRPDIATALADSAIPDPGYFSVPVAGTTDSLILYRKASGTATEVTRYPSSAGFVSFPPQSGLLGGWVTSTGRILLVFSAEDGRPIFGVGGDITARLDAAFSQIAAVAASSPGTGYDRSGFSHAWLTPNNRKLLWADDTTGKIMIWDRDVLLELDAAKTAVTQAATATANVALLNTRVGAVELAAPATGYDRGGFLHAWLTPLGRKLIHSDDETGRIKIWDRDILAELDIALSGSQQTSQALSYILPNTNILAVGDSLTAGSSSWAATINTYTTVKSRSIINLAVGGQKSTHQSGRLGVVPFLITVQNNLLLAAAPTTVTLSRQMKRDGTWDNVMPITNQGATWRAKLKGIPGTFSSATFDGSGNPTALVFTADVGAISSNTYIDEDTPAESLSAVGAEMRLLLVGIGRNNTAEFDNVCRDLLAIRDKWQPTSYKRMIVVTPPPRWKNPSTGTVYGEGSGGTAVSVWNQIIAIEKWCQANFGEYVVVSRQELMRNASASADDQEAVANGSVPPSLTGDGLHWTAAGHAIIGAAAAAIINRKGF